MQSPNELHSLIATALIGVVKQIKAIRYYPAKHPALQAVAEESLRNFGPILAEGNHLSLVVRKNGFLFDDCPIAINSTVLSQLANFCFARRIQHLTFLADLNSRDLHYFVHFLLFNPQNILNQGGFQEILEKARLTTIWVNIINLDDILERRAEIEMLPPEPDFDPAEILAEGGESAGQKQDNAKNLATLLDTMEREENDARFQKALQDLIPLLRLQMNEEQRPQALRAFLLLCRNASGMRHSEERRQAARAALEELTTEESVGYLVTFMFAKGIEPKVRELLAQILAFLGSGIANQLIRLLVGDTSTARRRMLHQILVRTGEGSLPTLYKYLDDEHWQVVRDVVAVIGGIRNPESLERLAPLLKHCDLRVRKETIRALTRIGGSKAINLLLQAATVEDQELRRQAILSLGAMRATEAISTLVSILKKSDWSQRGIDLKKDTIRALGEIRDPAAIPVLTKIVAKKSWLRRKLNNELRIAAIATLGDLAEESSRKILEKASNDRASAVARVANQALKQLDKAVT